MSTYLVTGGAGFIGSHVVERLAQRGEQIRVLDNFSSGSMENLTQSLDCVEVIRAGVEDRDAVRRAMDGADYVVHLAALASVPQSVDDPVSCNDSNITGTLNVLLASRDAGVRRVVYASSSAVYGDGFELPKTEDMFPRPLSPYALTKLAGEHYCRLFTSLYGLETVSLRYFNVFGPRQSPHSEYAAVIARFMSVMVEGNRPTIYGDGLQTRDFSYVGNNVTATLLACTRPKIAGEVLNIASGESLSLSDLVRYVNDVLGRDLEPVFAEPRTGDVRHSSADITKARELLGWEPEISLHEGLAELANWIRSGNA